jgi:hypothetical protein
MTAAAGTLTAHAQDRIFQRSRLTPAEAQAMLDAQQYCWANKPRSGQDSYALMFDAVAQDFIVAVVEASSRVVKTILTLKQFEAGRGAVGEVVKLLARMTLLPDAASRFAGAGPMTSLTFSVLKLHEVDALVKVIPAPAWRFSVRDISGAFTVLGTLPYSKICEFFFCKPVTTESNLKLRAGRLVSTSAFFSWFAQGLDAVQQTADSVEGLFVEALTVDTDEAFCSADVTEAFSQALCAPDAARQDARTRELSNQARRQARYSSWSATFGLCQVPTLVERANALH